MSNQDNKNLTFEVSLPGVDPKTVKVTYNNSTGNNTSIYVNNRYAGTILSSQYYDFSKASATIQYGLLAVTVPEKEVVRPEIPLTIL